MDIIIDHRIRDWVFFPIIFVMFMVNMFKRFLSQYQKNVQKKQKVKSEKEFQEISHKNYIQKCKSFAKNCHFLSEASYKNRKYFLTKQGSEGHLIARGDEIKQEEQQQAMPMQGMMENSLKQQFTNIFSTMLQFGWVNYFFSGFILAKIPFPLTQKFRGMLQKGVEIQNINVGYVSSLSLYFLVLFGLNGLQRLVLGDEDEDSLATGSEGMDSMNAAMMMNPMMGGGMPGMGAAPGANPAQGMMGMGQGPDYKQLLKSEKENIELIRHNFVMDGAEDLLINKLKTQEI